MAAHVSVAEKVGKLLSDGISTGAKEHWALLLRAVQATWEALTLWCAVLWPIVSFALWCIRGLVDFLNPLLPVLWNCLSQSARYAGRVYTSTVKPKIIAMAKVLWHRILRLDSQTLIIAAVSAVVLLVIWRMVNWTKKHDIIGRAKRYVQTSGQQARRKIDSVLAVVTSFHWTWHLIFALHLLFFLKQGSMNDREGQLSALFWVGAVVVPSILSFLAIQEMNVKNGPSPNVIRWLKYWTVIGSGWAFLELPLMETFVQSIPKIVNARVHFVVWLWLPYTDGATLVFDPLAGFLNRTVFYWLPFSQSAPYKQLTWIWNTAAAIGSLTHIHLILNNVTDSFDWLVDLWPILPCFALLIMTGAFNRWASYYSGLLFAVYRTTRFVSVRLANEPADSAKMATGQYAKRWLSYWTVFSSYKMAHRFFARYLSRVILWYNTYHATVLALHFGLALLVVNWLGVLLGPYRAHIEKQQSRVKKMVPVVDNVANGSAMPSSSKDNGEVNHDSDASLRLRPANGTQGRARHNSARSKKKH